MESVMKLYIYDHCPYCVRARMIFGMLNVPVQIVVLDNDDDRTPIQLIGKKMVPILVKNNQEAMGESLDIVNYIDQNHNQMSPISKNIRAELQQWLQAISQYDNQLVMPRCINIGLAEFQTQSAIDYYVKKKTQYIGDFKQALDNSSQYIEKLNKLLLDFPRFLKTGASLYFTPGMEDILVFPTLRNLTMVKGLEWPFSVTTYLKEMSKLSKVDLYFDRAI